jgi:hypothetical protein
MRRNLHITLYWKGLLILASLFLCFQATSYAADVTLQWDANTEPDLAGYRIYQSDTSGIYTFGPDYDVEDLTVAQAGDPPSCTLTNVLNATWYWVVTAYDTEGLESEPSNEVVTLSTDTETTSGGGGDGGFCFIDTAAFGLKFEKHVEILRQFRDVYLMPHRIGQAFVKAYYIYSPQVIGFIADHDTVRTMVNWSLLPLIGLSWMAINMGALPTVLFLVAGLIMVFAFIFAVKRKIYS